MVFLQYAYFGAVQKIISRADFSKKLVKDFRSMPAKLIQMHSWNLDTLSPKCWIES